MGDNYETDSWLMSLFDDWFDPCPLNPEWLIDGLNINWKDRTFVNPPYSGPLEWVQKSIDEHQTNGHTIVLLLKHDSSTLWYKLLHEAGARFLMIQGRLKYHSKRPAPFPSILAVLGGDGE